MIHPGPLSDFFVLRTKVVKAPAIIMLIMVFSIVVPYLYSEIRHGEKNK